MLRRRDDLLHRLRFDDEPPKTLARQEFPPPPEQRPESATPQNQELNVNEGPHQLGESAGRAEAERLHHGGIAAYRGKVALVEVLERRRLGFPLQPARDQASDVAALLDRHLGDARERFPVLLVTSRVSHDEDFWMRRDGAV